MCVGMKLLVVTEAGLTYLLMICVFKRANRVESGRCLHRHAPGGATDYAPGALLFSNPKARHLGDCLGIVWNTFRCTERCSPSIAARMSERCNKSDNVPTALTMTGRHAKRAWRAPPYCDEGGWGLPFEQSKAHRGSATDRTIMDLPIPGRELQLTDSNWRPRRDVNPCDRRERAVS